MDIQTVAAIHKCLHVQPIRPSTFTLFLLMTCGSHSLRCYAQATVIITIIDSFDTIKNVSLEPPSFTELYKLAK